MTHGVPKPVPSLLAPGSLSSRCQPIELHTFQGVHLFLGQRREGSRPGYPGLRLFSHLVSNLYRQAARDDPWADWWLLKVEEALSGSGKELEQLSRRLESRLAESDLQVVNTASQKPTTVTLHFGTPYGYLGARLLLQYDGYVRRIVHARHAALLDRCEQSRWIRQGRKAVIRAYLSATGYRPFDVTRTDLDPPTEAALAAGSRMGALPQEVAAGRLRAKHAPTIVARIADPLRQSMGAAGSATR